MLNIMDYWNKEKSRCVMTVIKKPGYRQLPDDELVPAAIESLKNWQQSSANLPPVFFPDCGAITPARPWGGECVRQENGEIFIKPVAKSIQQALDIEPQENPCIKWATDGYRQLCHQLGRSDILFRSPEMTGPLNTAALIVNQTELMIAFHNEPDKVHELLDRITDVNINYLKSLLKNAGRLDGNVWPYIWIPHQIGIMLTEDYMPLLSPEMYKEFGIPYLERISKEFGGVFIHCCGQFGHHIKNLANSKANILGLEFHYPFTRIEQIQEYLPNVVITPYLSDFGDSEYENYLVYIDNLLKKCENQNPLWIALWQEDMPVVEFYQYMKEHQLYSEGFEFC